MPRPRARPPRVSFSRPALSNHHAFARCAEYSDQEEAGDTAEDGVQVEAQNLYYGAKAHTASGAFADAAKAFEALLALEAANPAIFEWGFKAQKQLTKINIAKGDYDTGMIMFQCVGGRQAPARARGTRSLTPIFLPPLPAACWSASRAPPAA